MSRSSVKLIDDKQTDTLIQENVVNWQSPDNPLAPLTEEQLEIFYEIGDVLKNVYSPEDTHNTDDVIEAKDEGQIPIINSNIDFVKWMIEEEKEVQNEHFKSFQSYRDTLSNYRNNSSLLLSLSELSLESLDVLKQKYENVTEKTNYLHNLSEQLMVSQKYLKEKKADISEKLKYFIYFAKCVDTLNTLGQHKVNSAEFIELLNSIDAAIKYLSNNLRFKESNVYKMKYESLLNTSLSVVYNYINGILLETSATGTEHIIEQSKDSGQDSVFSFYYGKFQSSSLKMNLILPHLESKHEENSHYKNTLYDCQKSYFEQRFSILDSAVSKALQVLKVSHKNDYSVLFRSCCFIIVKVCVDEANCYNYFFQDLSTQFQDYLGTLCENLYDTLRPCLIHINHIEILCELCSILKSELSSEKVVNVERFSKYAETIRQLLQDVEERLVFRVNMFFKHDLRDYKPSPGDLAYPEKLQQMVNVIEVKERRSDSRSSIQSSGSQELTQMDASHIPHLRSYTGNSPADLHGMWYPTVKRTLSCLSRLYFCMDKETFQTLAQEALIICVGTLYYAGDLISAKKTPIDGKLFEIKHLLIIREQIAPFQVDFTTKEVALDFSNVQKAAVDLVHKRTQIFSFSSNNALLEFLLEGTPKVKEYFIDSRKEIDKKLKHCCESFITHITKLLIGNVLGWIDAAEKYLQTSESAVKGSISKKDFGQPEVVSALVKDAEKSMKSKIPEIQRSMQLYLANKETEFILFRPIKNNVLNAFIQMDQIIVKGGYTADDQLQIACPTPEHVNILICSVSLTGE